MFNKIVLIGGAGAPNYGDELIVKGWKDYFLKTKKSQKVIFYENIAKKEVEVHGEESGIVFRDGLVKIAKNVADLDFWDQVIRGYKFIESNGFDVYASFDIDDLKDADVIHLHGGGYLNNFDPDKGFYIGLLAALKKSRDVRVIATGIGFGPAPDVGKHRLEIIDEIFSYFDFFELRDVDNFRLLQKKFPSGKFIYGLDDCYLLKSSDFLKNKRKSRKKRMYLSFLEYNVRKIGEEFWDWVIEKSKDFDEVVFFESYPWQDRKVYDFVKTKMDNVRYLTLQESLAGIPMSSEDFVICARFHVHYAFSRNGVSGVYSKDSRYYDIKHQSILDLGSDFLFSGLSTPPEISEKQSLSYKVISDYDEAYCKMKIKLVNQIYGD